MCNGMGSCPRVDSPLQCAQVGMCLSPCLPIDAPRSASHSHARSVGPEQCVPPGGRRRRRRRSRTATGRRQPRLALRAPLRLTRWTRWDVWADQLLGRSVERARCMATCRPPRTKTRPQPTKGVCCPSQHGPAPYPRQEGVVGGSSFHWSGGPL